jgi:serine/threonine protein kinase/WD40 repeat protein
MSHSSSEPDPLDQLAEEFMARCRRGERPAVSEYTTRRPDLAKQIRDLFPALLVMEDLGSVGGEATGTFAPKAGDDPAPRQLGEYRILRQVGHGGMGVVYEAVQESLGRHVAVKVLPFHAALTGTQLERFRREARAVARLHHSNIVPVFGVGEDQGVHYYAMQFIQGQSLDAVLEELKQLRSAQQGSPLTTPPGRNELTVSLSQGLLTGQFPQQLAGADAPLAQARPADGPPASASQTITVREGSSSSIVRPRSELTGSSVSEYFRGVARVGVQVAEALEYAHRNRILHRDVKPSNLLLDTQGTVWVTDFGLAKAEDGGELTNPGDIVGTLRFMAPERFRGQSDPRSDIYSLAITLYEMLTLRPAFDPTDRARLIERVTHENPPRPRQLDPHIPRDLETIVLKAIAKEPGDRYPIAGELAEDLRRFLADRPIRARRTSALERTWRWCRRNPAVAALTAFIALLVVTIAVGASLVALKLDSAATDLREERDKAQRSEQEAIRAEREKTEELARSSFKEAQARRWSGLMGRRFDSLESLTKAAAIYRSLGQLDEPRELELRNEAIACMTLPDLRIAKEWGGYPPGAAGLVFDANLERYACSDAKGNISIRRVADDGELVRLPGPGKPAWYLRFSPNGRFLAAHYGPGPGCHVWNVQQGETILKLQSRVDFTPDSRRLLTAGGPDGRTISIYDLASGKELKRLAPHPVPIYSLALHPDGRQVAVSSGQGNLAVQIRDVETDKLLMTFPHPRGVRGIAWRPDGKLLAAACSDFHIHIWDVATRQRIGVLEGHHAEPTEVVFNRAGNLLASTGWDGHACLWDPLAKKLLIRSPRGCSYGFPKYQFGPDDSRLAFAWDGVSKVGLWEVATGRECRAFHHYLAAGARSWSADFSPDDRLLASGDTDGVRLWDLAFGKQVAHLYLRNTRATLFLPDGRSLLVCSNSGLYCWPIEPDPKRPEGHLRIGPPQRLLDLSPNESATACLALDGGRIAVSDRAREQVLVLDLQGQAKTVALPGHEGIARVMISPDGRWIAAGTWGGPARVRVAAVANKQVVAELPVSGTKTWAGFSPDGKWLATCGDECRLWRVGTWQLAKIIPREPRLGLTNYAAFSPDGRILAIAYHSRVVRLVDASTGRELATLAAPNPVSTEQLCFNRAGSQLAVVCGNHVIQVWDLRLIRQQLAAMGLDWDVPSYPSASKTPAAHPLRVQVDLGQLARVAQ